MAESNKLNLYSVTLVPENETYCLFATSPIDAKKEGLLYSNDGKSKVTDVKVIMEDILKDEETARKAIMIMDNFNGTLIELTDNEDTWYEEAL